MEKRTFERALHSWDAWHESIEKSRELLGYDPKWSSTECSNWIENNYPSIREQAEKQLQLLELPPTLRQYWEDCFYSDYKTEDGKTDYTKITRRLSSRKSFPALPCDYEIMWLPGEDIHSPWLRIEIKMHARFASKELLSFAAKHAYRTLESEISWRNLAPHPVTQWLQGGRPTIDEGHAIECARLADDEGWSEVKIGKHFGWKIQEDSYGTLSQCRTARRYVKAGRELRKNTGQ